MAQPGTFYVLGAGASAGLVPFTPQLGESIKLAFWSVGIYPVFPSARTTLYARVIGSRLRARRWDIQELVLDRITPGALDLLVQQQFSYPLHLPVPPQYWLLQRVAAPSVFFSFNLDGLARVYLRRQHVVFEPHGAVDREWTEASNFGDLLELTLDIELPHLRPKVLPGREPTTITGTAPYLCAQRWLRQAPAAILLGYSFGKSTTGFDDAESFEYMTEHLKATRCIVFVVSPEPFELAALLEQRLRAQRVVPVVLYWDTFSRAAMSMIRPWQEVSEWICEDQICMLERAYVDGLKRFDAQPRGAPGFLADIRRQ